MLHTLFLLVSMAVATPLAPQATTPATPTITARLVAMWTGKGSVNNAPVTAKAEFDVVLANRFTRLRYVFTSPNIGQVFEGHAYYLCAAATCKGYWLDSQRSMHLLQAVETADALTAEWGDGITPRGRTEYKLTSATTLVVTDWIRTPAGEWRQFGKVDYTRD